MSNTKGFELRELRLCGPDVPPAQLLFKTGLNVIEGASDTGKSYAVSCIDFLLGAKDAPEEIPQARGYDVSYLVIQARATHEEFTLKRALVGGQIGLYNGPIEKALAADDSDWDSLGLKANARKSVSGFLLGLCDLADKRVRSDAYGKTQTVSFRVLGKALIVDEQRIIAKQSPLYGTQSTGYTAAQNTIRLLLTGVDDSQIVQPEDKKTATGRLAGKKEVIEKLITQDETSIKGLLEQVEKPLAAKELDDLEQALSELAARSSAALADLRKAENKRQQLWEEQRNSEERVSDLDGQLVRADLLQQHYDSDLRRLEAMAESAHVLEYYSEEPCAYCGAQPEHQNHSDDVALQKVMGAAQFEAAKIKRLTKELEQARNQMLREKYDLHARIKTLEVSIGDLSKSIEDELAPQTQRTAAKLQILQTTYGKWVRVAEIQSRLESLRQQLNALEEVGSTKEKGDFVKLTANTMAGVCKDVSVLLDAWGFAENPTVSYDEKTADLHIDGRSRVSHGKGVRAVICAAFVIAVMRHGINKALGHPGFVIVDTPLNPYKAAKISDDGAVRQSVKTAFYQHLSKSSVGQVIVFENEPVPDDIQANCNYEYFSGSASGRQGFIPSPGSHA